MLAGMVEISQPQLLRGTKHHHTYPARKMGCDGGIPPLLDHLAEKVKQRRRQFINANVINVLLFELLRGR